MYIVCLDIIDNVQHVMLYSLCMMQRFCIYTALITVQCNNKTAAIVKQCCMQGHRQDIHTRKEVIHGCQSLQLFLYLIKELSEYLRILFDGKDSRLGVLCPPWNPLFMEKVNYRKRKRKSLHRHE